MKLFSVELHGALENYLRKFPKVEIVRSTLRQGIIGARLLGSRIAKGPVLVFLDSHVEVMYGWLEPVLDRFKYQNELLVTMWHRNLCPYTLKFDTEEEKKPTLICAFLMSMDFAFLNLSFYEGNHPTPSYDPKPSPTIFGSMHAIRKDFFVKIGLYDEGFDIWGGEDIE